MAAIGFAVLPAHIARNGDVSLAGKGLLLALSSYADTEGTSWPSLATLAKDVGLSKRQVQRHLRSLERDGWVSVQQRRGQNGGDTSSLYLLRFDRWGGNDSGMTDVSGGVRQICQGGVSDVSDPPVTSVAPPVSPVSPKQDQTNKTREVNTPLPPQGGLELTEPKAKKPRKRTVAQAPPSLDVVAAYFAEKGSTRDQAERFHDYWTDQGWSRRSGPMRSWQGSARTWIKNNNDGNGKRQPAHTKAHDYDNDPAFAGKEW